MIEVPLSELSSQKSVFYCELESSILSPVEKPIQLAITPHAVLIKDDATQQIEEWPFEKIRSYNLMSHYFWTDEVLFDLTPYQLQPLIISSPRAVEITQAIQAAIDKRVHYIQQTKEKEKTSSATTTRPKSKSKSSPQSSPPPPNPQFTYSATLKMNEKAKKKVCLEISPVGLRLTEDKRGQLLAFATEELLKKHITNIKSVVMAEEKQVVVDLGETVPVDKRFITLISDEAKLIVDTFFKMVDRNTLSESSSEDSEQ
eukprot:TRINITY_DN16382_c0_g1_i1.p1 TRINITY_DN16382_c0_g1~~TRINITY_DN16382_c0_g1_i1.p1  ORF type:complete len:258 (-),score=71.04 TRINITY_DN16382_c0_g1_i1:106-879(-)